MSSPFPPAVPRGRIKTFGPLGPPYEVGEPICPTADGDWMVAIVLVQTGEHAQYRLSHLQLDPDAV